MERVSSISMGYDFKWCKWVLNTPEVEFRVLQSLRFHHSPALCVVSDLRKQSMHYQLSSINLSKEGSIPKLARHAHSNALVALH